MKLGRSVHSLLAEYWAGCGQKGPLFDAEGNRGQPVDPAREEVPSKRRQT